MNLIANFLVSPVAASFELSIDTQAKTSVAELESVVKEGLAVALGVPEEQIIRISIFEEGWSEVATEKTRRLLVTSKELVSYEVAVPAETTVDQFMKVNEELVKKGSPVQNSLMQSMAYSHNVLMNDVTAKEVPYLEKVPVSVASKGVGNFHGYYPSSAVIGLLSLIVILGVISIWVIRNVGVPELDSICSSPRGRD